jgi:hypothetical protein
MKRVELLKQSLTEDKNVDLTIEKAVKDDKRFINRSARSIEDQIEDQEAKLEERLSSNTPLDASTIESVFGNIKTLKEKLNLYKEFQEKYL